MSDEPNELTELTEQQVTETLTELGWLLQCWRPPKTRSLGHGRFEVREGRFAAVREGRASQIVQVSGSTPERLMERVRAEEARIERDGEPESVRVRQAAASLPTPGPATVVVAPPSLRDEDESYERAPDGVWRKA